MSLLDVFKDFEYDDEDDHSSFFHDTFSQILNDDEEEEEEEEEKEKDSQSGNDKKPVLDAAKKTTVHVEDFEEAFTLLKSIESAHHPPSYTSINAYLHHLRATETNQRAVHGLVWPEHPETFHDSRLLSNPPHNFTDHSNLLVGSDDDGSDEPLDTLFGPCKMAQSPHLLGSLLRTVHAIFIQKTAANPGASLHPRLAHSIARRTAFLLQTVFTRAALNRRSAVRVLKQFPQADRAVDIDNVPSNWESTKMAAEQIVGQAAFDQDTFTRFSTRLDETFKQ